MNIQFIELTQPTDQIAATLARWENDPTIAHLMRVNQSQADLDEQRIISPDELAKRIEHQKNFLIYMDGQLVGEMSYQKDPPHLYKKDVPTAWVGITIGEASARGKGVGALAMQFLEEEIQKEGFNRIELGVFEFNEPAQKLYKKMGYTEIGRIPEFTFWQGKMWTDIRMEKVLH